MKLPWHEFMNTTDELHSFVIGFFEVLCPWPAHCHCEPKLRAKGVASSEAISKEYHYYAFGRGMAVMAWILIAKIVQEVFW